MVKNLPVMQEMQVRALVLEDSLEKKMANHSSILTWEILWTEESGGLQSMGSKRVRYDLATKQQQPCMSDMSLRTWHELANSIITMILLE